MTTISLWRPKVRLPTAKSDYAFAKAVVADPAVQAVYKAHKADSQPTVQRRTVHVPPTSQTREQNPLQGGQDGAKPVPAPTLAPPAPEGAQPMPQPRLVAPSLVAPASRKRTPLPAAVAVPAPKEAQDAKAAIAAFSKIVKDALAPAEPVKVAGSSVTLNAERRIDLLRGQIANDCANLAGILNSVGERIREGATPRQDGEVGTMAHKIDQNCASLYELLRLVRCYP